MNKLYSIGILALLWALWCSLHSLLISRSFTARMEEIWGIKFAYYRLAYNSFSILTLIPVVVYQQLLKEQIIFSWSGPWPLLKFGMYLASFVLFYGGYRVFDMQYFLGIKQIDEMRGDRKIEAMNFNTTGILQYVRHPWYSGAIFLVWAFGPISDVSLVSKIILTAYLIIGTFLEEKKLIHEIGEPYLEYRKKVPMLIPWKKGWFDLKE
ncbi:methyltransferase family protein [Thermodesulfobacteriota bacterium]